MCAAYTADPFSVTIHLFEPQLGFPSSLFHSPALHADFPSPHHEQGPSRRLHRRRSLPLYLVIYLFLIPSQSTLSSLPTTPSPLRAI
jgi:hypothetical protein